MIDYTKPQILRLTGDRAKAIEFRNFAEKLLADSKRRNETVGNYANPFFQYRDDEKTIQVTSLKGYDIIHIFVPLEEGGEELKTIQIYSGITEARFNPAGLEWYLRYWPSNYELYNIPAGLDKGLASSVDGVIVAPEMPPNRWMYNDYDDAVRTEALWFGKVGPAQWLLQPNAGRFSGQLRKLVQLQLGAGLNPRFNPNFSGIRLETLADGKTRIWLYVIGPDGIHAQVMDDYSPESYERKAGLRPGGLPTEIEEAGFYTDKTSFDALRDEYTPDEYAALTDPPSILTVTFKLLDAGEVEAVTAGYAVYGDYGWSFNSDCTSAVLVGIGDNMPAGRNFKSQLFTISINELVVSVGGGGEKLFLMDSSFDSIKFPNAAGLLTSYYFWRATDGFKGTQPSSSYSAPMYAYYDLQDQLQVVSYEFTEPSVITPDGGSWRGWAETLACRTVSSVEHTYENCTTGRDGTGVEGGRHGFASNVTGANEEVYGFTGAEYSFSQPEKIAGYMPSAYIERSTPGGGRPYGIEMSYQYIALKSGAFSGAPRSVLVIPSFERLAYYHFKNYIETLSSGQLSHEGHWLQHGSPLRAYGDGNIGPCDPGIELCPDNGGVTTEGQSLADQGYTTYVSWSGTNNTGLYESDAPENCGVFDPGGPSEEFGRPCWNSPPGNLTDHTPAVPADQNPYSEVSAAVTGGLLTPHGTLVVFSDADMNAAEPFRESSPDFGEQAVVSAFDTFGDNYVFSLPDVGITSIQDGLDGQFNTDFIKVGVAFTGAPYYR